jgi:MinD-like ATPase involved in chromosome partitioning or flagellar assembly
MGMILAIWGKSGSGKSVLSTNLSCALAKKDNKVALIGANRFYGSIQHYFGMGIKNNESLRSYFTDMMYSNIESFFIECGLTKNLYISSQSNYDDCLGFRKFSKDKVKRFLNLAGECFDYIVVDCDESMDDALSMISLASAHQVVYVTRPTVHYAAFSFGFESLVNGLNLKEKMLVVINYDKRYSDVAVFLPFGIRNGYLVLPYCQMIEKLENSGKPILLSNCRDKSAKKFVGRINELAGMITHGEESLREDAPDYKKPRFFSKIAAVHAE